MARRFTEFYPILESPLIAVIGSGVGLLSGIRHAVAHAAGRRCHLVVRPCWHLSKDARRLARVVRGARRRVPTLDFSFLCPTMDDVLCLRALGLDALHVHSNAFIDHRAFRPLGAPKRFDAVHVANPQAFKRHRLAWGVRDIAVITYDSKHDGDFSELAGYRHLRLANFRPTPQGVRLGRRLAPQEVARVIDASRCGLILSAVEGQNNASTEYLLCGVPVVSTPSVGGRDAFFDPRHVRIVDPDPAAVEAAVAELARAAIDPREIRASVMHKIREHRRRFIAWLCAVSDADFFAQADANFWIPHFEGKLRRRVEP